MNGEEVVKELRNMLPPQVDYAELVCSPVPSSYGQHYVWTEPEPYIIEKAADLIESLQADVQRLTDEPHAYKFYYCESEDSYLLGRRVDNFYYAHWHEGLGFAWDMSRYLPWGEHVVAPDTAWKEHTYPTEPKEIGPGEWFKGFMAQRIADSQRRERAAREALRDMVAQHYTDSAEIDQQTEWLIGMYKRGDAEEGDAE